MQRFLMAMAALVTVILAAPVAADDPAKGGAAVASLACGFARLKESLFA
jgi:hypothetical protein